MSPPQQPGRPRRGHSPELSRDDAVNIKSVARVAGVSVGTVSNVLNRPDKVAPATRTRVEAVMDRIGFVRNEAAASVRRGHSQLIGLIVPDIANPFFAAVASAATDLAFAHGYTLVLCNSDGDARREAQYLTVMAEQRAAGILLNPVGRVPDQIARMVERGTRAVLVDRAAPVRSGCSASVDDVLGGELAVDHLLSRGARSLVLVNGPTSLRQCADRRKGARRAVARAGLLESALLEVVSPTMSIAGGVHATVELLRRSPHVDGVFCANDLLAIGVSRALVAERRSVPGDVAVVGYDDIPIAAEAPVPLTSIVQPKAELGRAAVELLLAEISGVEHLRHEHVAFTPALVERESSRRNPTALTVA